MASPSHSPTDETRSFMDRFDAALGEFGHLLGQYLFVKPLEGFMGGPLWTAHHHDEPCENTERLDELLHVTQMCREIVVDHLPAQAFQLPSKTPAHNQEMISLARTLRHEDQKAPHLRYALEELSKEWKSRFRTLGRPAENQESIDAVQAETDHAWEMVYHWHHVLLGSGTAVQVPEKELYIPALQRLGGAGDLKAVLQSLSNPKTYQVLFPEMYEAMLKKRQHQELKRIETVGEVLGKVQNMTRLVVDEISDADSSDLKGHAETSSGLETQDKVLMAFMVVLVIILLLANR